jgi:hypothetical protein
MGLLALTACGKPAQVLVRMQGAPDDALVTVDDRYIGKLGRIEKAGMKLPPGVHRLTIEANGYFPHDQILELMEGAPPSDVVVELQPVPD